MDLSDSSSLHQSSTADVNSKNTKRKASNDAESITGRFAIADILEDIDAGRYGNVDQDMKALFESRMAALQPFYKSIPDSVDGSCRFINDASDIVDLRSKSSEPAQKLISIDLDVEEDGAQTPVQPHQDVPSKKSRPKASKVSTHGGASHSDKRNIKKDNAIHVYGDEDVLFDNDLTEKDKPPCIVLGTCNEKDKGTYVGVEDDLVDETDQQYCNNNDDDLDNLWQEMAYAQELCKDDSVDTPPHEHVTDDDEEDCEHSLILQDDIGYVCRICGIIKKEIGSIIEYQYAKKKSTRTYKYEGFSGRAVEGIDILGSEMRSSAHDFVASKIYIHPRHNKVMKPHQVEGFNFLARNLVDDNPGGCILAHAPGSGKTLMIISFIQSFMAKYPSARPLVVLPKGILPTWKKEFLLWQVDNIPLLDFYSVNANSRSQQLEVLEQWVKTRSILFLGYVQFSSIVCDPNTNETTAACEKILLKQPSILIMDEGHTPRTENTDQLAALERVETPRKVVLSGTLYQNHVKEVFNILNLVRPRFLKMEACKDPKKRILSLIETRKKGNLLKKSDNEFYEMVEESLLRDGDLKRKALIIQGLREMTDKVLHYYKGDSLDELPGLVDFTVFINLSPRQKREVEELKKLGGRFKMSSDGGSIFVHPQLKDLLKNTARKDRVNQVKIDKMLHKLDINAGAKAKFYLNLLRFCELTGEKLLVFSQYLLPMKFLERLTVKVKGWTPGKEIFMITGDSDNDIRELHMEQFNNSSHSRVFFGSIKACSEGISLVGASRIILLDIHLNPSVTRQAIGRAFRPGQVRKVYTYRLVAAGTLEQEDHSTCFKKESIPKLWFEWNEACRPQDFQLTEVDVTDCGDDFMETPNVHKDVVSLYRR